MWERKIEQERQRIFFFWSRWEGAALLFSRVPPVLVSPRPSRTLPVKWYVRDQSGVGRRCQDVCTSSGLLVKGSWPGLTLPQRRHKTRWGVLGEKGSCLGGQSILLAGGFPWCLPRILRASGGLFETRISMEWPGSLCSGGMESGGSSHPPTPSLSLYLHFHSDHHRCSPRPTVAAWLDSMSTQASSP